MLAIQCYRFLIGSKIPFSDWPQIVQTFLEQQSLHYKRFLYYFEDAFGACPKAVKNAPKLGPVRLRPAKTGDPPSIPYLSNIEDGIGCSEAEIMSLMSKIYRRYGFGESHIIYQDIDFFSRNVPAIVQAPGNTPSCIKGSSITLYRDSVFPRWSSIDLHIVIHDGTNTLDPAPYRDAMAALLPRVHCMGFLETLLSPKEEEFYTERNKDFKPLVEQATDYFSQRMPMPPKNNISPTDLSLAPVLKKLCKRHGYTYSTYLYYSYFMHKRTPMGHYICLEVDTGPNYGGTGVSIKFSGLGFDHLLFDFWFLPQNTADAAEQLTSLFVILINADQDLFPALDMYFPATPDWFSPIT